MFTYTSVTVTRKLEPPAMEPSPRIEWWKSRTIWAGVAQVIVGIAVAFGWVVEADSAAAQSWLTEILGTIVGGLGAASVWGRVMATREIKPEVLPKPTSQEPQA